MFLKAFSANIKGASSQIATIARSKFLQKSPKVTTVLIRSKGQYLNENAASNATKQNSSQKSRSVSNQKGTELSQHDMKVLNQDPDNFGTLSSSFKPLTVDDTQNGPSSTDSMDKSDVPPTEENVTNKQTMQQYEASMKDLMEKGHILEAIDLFETEVLQKHRLHAPAHIYKWLIEECIRLHEYRKAIDIYDQLVGRKMKVPFDIFEKIVLAFEQSNLTVGKLNNIQKVMLKKHIELNANMYNAMIRMYARSTQWHTAITLADEMKTKSMPYELDTANALFECFSYDKENGFYRLIELWHDMHRFDFTPNILTFNAILKCVKKCELTNVEKFKQMLETIRMKCTAHPNENEDEFEDGRPNLLQHPPYIGYLFPLEQVERPEHRLLLLGGLTNILNEFKKYNITPDFETIAELLEVVPNTFTAHQRVIGIMYRSNIKPDLQIFNVLLTRNCQTQNFQNAVEIIEMMHTADIEVDLVSYGLLAMSCTSKNDAEEFFELLASKNMNVDVDILNAMLKNACAVKDNDFVINILRKMRMHQIEPSEESIRMVDEYHTRVFRSLRTHRVVSKKMRNDCFKLTRECRQWKKHFRKDEPKDPTSKHHTQFEQEKYLKYRKNPKKTGERKSNSQNETSQM